MKNKPCLGRGRRSLRASRLARITVLVALAAGLPLALQTASASPGATRAGVFLQSEKSLLEESLAPLAHDLTSGVEIFSDLIVAPALSRV